MSQGAAAARHQGNATDAVLAGDTMDEDQEDVKEDAKPNEQERKKETLKKVQEARSKKSAPFPGYRLAGNPMSAKNRDAAKLVGG